MRHRHVDKKSPVDKCVEKVQVVNQDVPLFFILVLFPFSILPFDQLIIDR
jgi:hypothetical protein